jgi:predicted  nucleic acid-binding Zn-ribbon protein
METNDDTGRFVLGSDEALAGREIYQEQAHTRRIEKLSLKVTLISVLFPCAIGVLVGFLYMDMRDKMSRIESSGSIEMSKFEDQLSARLETIGSENGEFQKSLDVKITERIAAMGKTVNAVQSRIEKTEKDISDLSSLKSNNAALSADIQKHKTETLTLKKEMSALSSQNAKLSELLADTQKKILDISGIKSSNDALKQEIAKLKAENIDKGDLAAELKKQKVLYQLEIQELSNKFDKKIQALKADNAGNSK